MSEQAPAKKRSSRSPEAVAEALTRRTETEDVVSNVATETPVDPKSALGYRLALGAVITLAVLIVVAIGLLVVGFAKGWGHAAAPAEGAPAAPAKPLSMSLAPGFHILSNDTQPGRLILHVRSGTQDEIDIIDLNDGHVVAQIHAEAPR
ncbi:MAG: hypothetical protein KGJ78_00960 [Alphaproteobacteria bacterium]|nr:hypothetical protein [Alphaproteobacteria bacterium]